MDDHVMIEMGEKDHRCLCEIRTKMLGESRRVYAEILTVLIDRYEQATSEGKEQPTAMPLPLP